MEVDLPRWIVDGFTKSSFHSKGDGILGILAVAKSRNNNILGGYTGVDWSSNGTNQYKYDATAFLFILINSYDSSVKLNVIKPEKAIYVRPDESINSSSNWYVLDDSGVCWAAGLDYIYQSPRFLTFSPDISSFFG